MCCEKSGEARSPPGAGSVFGDGLRRFRALCLLSLQPTTDRVATCNGVRPDRTSIRSSYACATSPSRTNSELPFSSRSTRECYRVAAELFGWSRRNPELRSMRDGRLLIGGAWQVRRIRLTMHPLPQGPVSCLMGPLL
jgi:CO/xanthine dehydrogenase Mo-binding subunit